VGALGLLCADTLMVLSLCGASMLRENANFWRNSGGYSVEFRELVRLGFPVFLGLDVVLVGLAGLTLVRMGKQYPGLARAGLVVALIQSLLLGATVERMLRNNVSNLWNGRPLHWKQEVR
jgi:hypothetical protein